MMGTRRGWLHLGLWLMIGCGSAAEHTASGDDRDPGSTPRDGDEGGTVDGTQGSDDESGDGSGASPGDAAELPAVPESQVDGSDEPRDEEVANPFVDASQDPFSTFGADVDTASYDYFRQSIELYGVLPEPQYVRIEDFVNFFDYAYQAPAFDAEVPFAISLDASPHPMGRATKLLRVGIQAKDQPPAEKKPANIVFLVDTSGSMHRDDKLPLVQLLLTEALDVLDPGDTVSLVSYAGDVAVRLPPTEVRDAARIADAIAGLESSGGTAGASGIKLAYQQARGGFIEGGINHVILCTDGDFNIGVSSTEELVSLIEEERGTGVTLTALGFGRDNLNDAMMEAVSNAGNGMYAVVYSENQARSYAHDRLLSTVVHVAKDMKIQVEFNPALVAAYRLLGYEDRAVSDDDFRDDLVDGGEIGSGHRVTALYEVVLSGESVPMPAGAPALDPGETSDLAPEIGEGELVRVKVRYKAPGATDQTPAHEVASALLPADIGSEAAASDSDLAWAAAVATFAEILRESPYASEAELSGVETVVTAQAARDESRTEFATLFGQARALLAP